MKGIYKIEKELDIYHLSKTCKPKEIASITGYSESVVYETLKKFKMFGLYDEPANKEYGWNAAREYFAIGISLRNLFIEYNKDPDQYITKILNALWSFEITRRSKLKNLTIERLEKFLSGSRMKKADKVARLAIVAYRDALKHKESWLEDPLAE